MSKAKHTELPSGWEMKKLKDLGEIVSGLTYKPEMIRDKGILVLRSSNVQNRTIVYSDNVYVNPTDLKFNPVQEGDILICVRNGSRSLIGKNARIDKQADGFAFGAFMSVFRSKHNDYLLHVFDTDLYNREIHINLGATINSINSSELKEFKIPLPPLPEQRAIANILSTWDTAIQTTQALISQKEQEKKWLMQNLLTGKLRLRSASGDKFSGEWKHNKLKDICSLIKDGTHGTHLEVENGIPLLSAKDIVNGQIEIPNNCRKISIEDYNQIHKNYNLQIGDILLTVVGTIGRAAVIKKLNSLFTLQRSVAIIRTNEKAINTFLFQLFTSDFFVHLLNKNSNASAQAGIYLGELEKLNIKLPSLKEQTAIAQVLQTADKEIILLKTKLEQQKLQKKGLMQVLLTGKKRVEI
jgi:type I restriction enzyme, S subunit